MQQQMELAVEKIGENPFQPRKTFDADDIAELSASVKEHGILQPLLVRQVGEGFQLIAGERRLRAAREAGFQKVPVRVVNFNDQQTLEAALVENIQRSDLNPIEKAQGFKEYIDRFKMSHDQLAQRLGLARSTITNLVGLLDLTPEVQNSLRVGQITEGHAKILKGIKNPQEQITFCKQIIMQGLSVKAADATLRQMRTEGEAEETSEEKPKTDAVEKSPHVRGLEDELRQRLAVAVDIKLKGEDRGQIVLKFDSNDDFTRIIEWLLHQKAA